MLNAIIELLSIQHDLPSSYYYYTLLSTDGSKMRKLKSYPLCVVGGTDNTINIIKWLSSAMETEETMKKSGNVIVERDI